MGGCLCSVCELHDIDASPFLLAPLCLVGYVFLHVGCVLASATRHMCVFSVILQHTSHARPLQVLALVIMQHVSVTIKHGSTVMLKLLTNKECVQQLVVLLRQTHCLPLPSRLEQQKAAHTNECSCHTHKLCAKLQALRAC